MSAVMRGKQCLEAKFVVSVQLETNLLATATVPMNVLYYTILRESMNVPP